MTSHTYANADAGDRTTMDALLPVEIWDEVVPFLTGWELFNLMSVCRDAHALFSSAKWWHPRLPPGSPQPQSTAGEPTSSQRQYLDQQSFAFVLDDDAGKHASSAKAGPVALTAAFSIPFVFGRDSRAITIEIWFALRGSSDGGILLGAGTPFHVSPSWNPLFETWVQVDSDRNLYGSLLVPTTSERTPVACGLARDRWHQIVLTFQTVAGEVEHIPGAGVDRDNWRLGEERVYVNGELVTYQRGSLSRFWIFNSFVLLGTGCNSQAAAAQSADGKQWFPFKGVIDDMRVWHSVLSDHEIQLLASHQLDPIAPPIHSWKTLATVAAPTRLEDKSIEFRGSHESRLHSRGVSVTVVSRSNFQRGLMEDRLEFHPFCPDKSSSFAIEVWFYLLPENDQNWGGGVILGAQSRDVGDAYSPARTRQLIFVDRHGRLYASVLDEIMYPSAPHRLVPHRWYHVVLRYQDGKQDVYLNGVPKRSSHGALLRDWQTLSHMQVGTGCVNSTRGAPKGWYGFHGRIRDVRIWGPRLKDKHFTTILESSTATHVGSVRHVQPVFSLQKDGRLPHFVCVQNSRPHERVFVPRIDGSRGSRQHCHGTKEPETREAEGSSLRITEPALPHPPRASSAWLRSMWQKARTTLISH